MGTQRLSYEIPEPAVGSVRCPRCVQPLARPNQVTVWVACRPDKHIGGYLYCSLCDSSHYVEEDVGAAYRLVGGDSRHALLKAAFEASTDVEVRQRLSYLVWGVPLELSHTAQEINHQIHKEKL